MKQTWIKNNYKLIAMMKRHRLVLLTSVMALFFASLVYCGYQFYRLLYQPMISHSTNTTVILDKTTTATSFVQLLKKRQLIHSSRLLLAFIRINGLSHCLKAGIYQIHENDSALQFLNRVVAGDVLKQSMVIVEGTTVRKISAQLKQATYLDYHDVDWDVVSSSTPEGLLLADTYQYLAGSKARDVLARAHAALETYLDTSWQHVAANLPYKTAYDVLIAASIIEKETANSNEKRLIASVIVNRLNQHMPLQMDSTVVYGLGEAFAGQLTHHDLQVDSVYNTYRHRGLPPTPIAMVGKDAIDAAAHPAVTPYLYFVARGDGTHQFSTNYQDQKQAIAHYLRKKG